MKDTTINFTANTKIYTGTIMDKILTRRNDSRDFAETHYLVVDNKEGFIHLVHPEQIMEINP